MDDTIDPVTGLPKVPATNPVVGGGASAAMPPVGGTTVPPIDQPEQVNPEQSVPVELPKEETPEPAAPVADPGTMPSATDVPPPAGTGTTQ